MLKRMIYAIKGGFLWQKVLSKVGEKKFDQALVLIERIPRTKNFSIEVDMKKSQIFDAQSRSYECYTLAKSLISRINSCEIMNEQNKLYCTAYVQWLMQVNEKKVYPNRSILIDRVRNDILVSIKLDEIEDHFKMNFPLRIHPHWIDT